MEKITFKLDDAKEQDFFVLEKHNKYLHLYLSV